MEDILVSVLCVTYNHEKYVKKAIESFVNQKTDFKFEIIIHDDASTDGTASIIKEYAEKYPDIIVPILQKENQYSKIKKSIFLSCVMPHAKGKYVAFCEGDDYWCDETKLQQQADIMEKNPEYSICVHKVQCVNEDNSHNERIIPEESYKINKTCCLSRNEFADLLWKAGGYPFHTSSYFIRKSVFDIKENINKLETLMNGDQIFMKLSLICGKAYYIDEAMSHRRLMSIGNWNAMFKKLDIYDKINFFKKNVIGDFVFNDLSNNEFIDKIKVSAAKNIMGWALFEPYEAKKMLSNYEIKYSDVKSYLSIKNKIKFILCVYFTKITSLIKKRK